MWKNAEEQLIHSDLPGIAGKDDEPHKILAAAIKRINSFQMSININTDGSVLHIYF